MSETRSPAVALWEFASIVDGVHVADAIAKGTPVDLLYTGTTHPGKYVVLVAGDTASVEVATTIVSDFDVSPIDSVFLPDIAAEVTDAMVSADTGAPTSCEAVGLIETDPRCPGVDAPAPAVTAANALAAALRTAAPTGGTHRRVRRSFGGAVVCPWWRSSSTALRHGSVAAG